MKAMAIDEFESLPVMHDLEPGDPGQGEVRVWVNYASVNGFDLAIMGGSLKGVMDYRFPLVLGKDFAGIIDAVGPEVSGLSLGDRVFGVVMKATLGDGTFGEMVTTPAAYLTKVPKDVDLPRAAALGLAGVAALQAVEAIAPRPGETVLVSGATGGVGSFAVQLVAASGAHVIATARRGEEEFVRNLGASETVDYSGDVTEAVIAMEPDGVHSVVHLAGDGLQLADTVVSGGRIASTVGFGPQHLKGRDLQTHTVMALPNSAALERLVGDVVTGRLRVPIGRTYPLSDVPRALEDFSKPKLGKLVIAVS